MINYFFSKLECLTMVRDKKITFRVSKEEYEQLQEEKPKDKSLSEYIRELVLW